MLESRASEIRSFKAKLQAQIEELFLPPEDEEQIALAVLDQFMTEKIDIEVEPATHTNDASKGEKGRRRKSFSDGLGEKTLKSRYSELDELVEAAEGISPCWYVD